MAFASRLAPTAGMHIHVGASLLANRPSATPNNQTETKKNEAINPIPTNHTSERKIAQSAR
jgi:hypothetical protein